MKRQTKEAIYTLLSDCSYSILIVLPTIEAGISSFGFGEEEDVAEHFASFKTFWKQMVGFRLRDEGTASYPVDPGVNYCRLGSLSVSPQLRPPSIHENCSESRFDFSLIIYLFCFSARCCCGSNSDIVFPTTSDEDFNEFMQLLCTSLAVGH